MGINDKYLKAKLSKEINKNISTAELEIQKIYTNDKI
jgi:hypothetical protein